MATAAVPRPAYARSPEIKRLMKAARDSGLDPAGFEALPDGTVRVLEARAIPKPAENIFDRLVAEGKI
ncbi:MAG TPA: hypothetical protein VGF77_08270 [Allosphingosinicella sp.]|jgi:hypothetical protein